ncbi:serine protease inhibitor Cvsi-2-like [Saccostrea echinata]|uniref:serine protease inhibitor Cvsi-2-like n=1 Tax=Saccostrea echinata TaxID=191078 RepID=UPI002A80DE46|nr:serine protease inhibitor Cvsi-2-like [Saccostrea echinata]
MRTILILAVCVVAAYAETCSSHADCTNTLCSTGFELHCVNRECTCTHEANGGEPCTNVHDCHGRCTHTHDREHCIDGHCRCSH